jgi:flagellar basal body-associated protein FliL
MATPRVGSRSDECSACLLLLLLLFVVILLLVFVLVGRIMAESAKITQPAKRTQPAPAATPAALAFAAIRSSKEVVIATLTVGATVVTDALTEVGTFFTVVVELPTDEFAIVLWPA